MDEQKASATNHNYASRRLAALRCRKLRSLPQASESTKVPYMWKSLLWHAQLYYHGGTLHYRFHERP